MNSSKAANNLRTRHLQTIPQPITSTSPSLQPPIYKSLCSTPLSTLKQHYFFRNLYRSPLSRSWPLWQPIHSYPIFLSLSLFACSRSFLSSILNQRSRSRNKKRSWWRWSITSRSGKSPTRTPCRAIHSYHPNITYRSHQQKATTAIPNIAMDANAWVWYRQVNIVKSIKESASSIPCFQNKEVSQV